MKLLCTKSVLLLALLIVALAAAACAQSKPSAPTPTLVPLANETVVLPTAAPPGAETPVAPTGNETPVAPGGETAVPPPGSETAVPPPGGETPAPAEPTLLPTPTVPGGEVVPPATPVPGGETGPTGACTNPYIVQRGDWLNAIARKCGISLQQLLAANPRLNPNAVLRPGTQLRIPGGTAPQPQPQPTTQPGTCGPTYVIQRGDTLYSIAQKCGTTVAAIMQANNIPAPEYIFPGQTITIPGQ